MKEFIFVSLGIIALFGVTMRFQSNNRKCTDTELNLVIDKVNECKKQNVICPHSEIERLIKEVCGK